MFEPKQQQQKVQPSPEMFVSKPYFESFDSALLLLLTWP